MESVLSNHYLNRKITSLVENRTVYNAEYSELNIYETSQVANKVNLTFDAPIIASMLTGKKVMHLKGMPSFDFHPGESVILPGKEELIIDFPEATLETPTQCLALAIDKLKISEIVQNFNYKVAIENENNQWNIGSKSTHLTNQPEVNHLIQRMVHTYTNNINSKDVILDFMIQELIVRLLQTNAKYSFLHCCKDILDDTRIGTVIKYIKENLTHKDISVDLLATRACMSSSNFHKQFKNTLGISPIDFVNSERIKFSKKLIANDKKRSISDIAFLSGFNSVSYFNRQFKKHEMISPSQYRKVI